MAKKKFYAVAVGRKCGIYTDWASCEAQVKGFSGWAFKGFGTRAEAEAYMREHCQEPWEDTAAGNESASPAVEEKSSDSYAAMAQAEAEPVTGTPQDEDFRAQLQAKINCGRQQAEPLTESVLRYCEDYGFQSLTEEQRRAVQQVDGKSLLFAVPGSGKTSVIIARAGYLLHGGHGKAVYPTQLMTLTFTRAAAQEMRERYRTRFPQDEYPPEFRTIHSFCLTKVINRLREAGMDIPPYVLGEEQEAEDGQEKEQRVSLKQVLHETVRRVDPEGKRHALTQDDCTAITIALTGLKNCMLQPEDYQDKVVTLSQIQLKVPDLLREYQAVLKEHNCFDYDDMIAYAVQGLQQYPHVLRALQATYRYWSVDETQDNSRLQQELLQLLVGGQGNLFVVGDDDQSIYAFRGAAPQLLLEYGLQEQVKALVMGMNFRSDSRIVRVAEQFISANKRRAAKEMQAFSPREGEIAFFTHLPTQDAQYAHILQAAKEAEAGGQSLGVLYRLNASAVPVMLRLHQAGIRFTASKPLAELLQGKYYQEILALLHFAAEPKQLKRFKACRLLLDFTNPALLKKLEELKKQEPQAEIIELLERVGSERDPQAFAERVKKTRELLTLVQQGTALEAVREIIRFTELAAKTTGPAERLRLYGMLSAAALFPNVGELLQAISEVTKQLRETEAEKKSGKGPLVALSTMHGAKGLQYDRVLIIDSFAGVMNYVREEKPDELVFSDDEEERRLFYVAITRAKQRLELLAVQRYWGEVVEPSSFLGECACLYEDLQCEPIAELPCTTEAERQPAAEQYMPQGVFYAVRCGRQVGIFTNWAECERSYTGYPGGTSKKFSTRAEAEQYLAEVCPVEKPLQHAFLQSILLPAPVHCFNYKADLPPLVTEAILDWLGVQTVAGLPAAALEELRRHAPKFPYKGETCYRDCVPNYTVAYMPINFYKSWLPLARCLEKKALPTQAKVLEFGPGPGTATLAVLEFYRQLALENPEVMFRLEYEAVDREPEFAPVFRHLTEYYLRQAALPNLSVQITLRQADGKAFLAQRQEPEYDIILESNALNVNEDATGTCLPDLAGGVVRALRPGGLALLVEPGYDAELRRLRSLGLGAALQELCPLQTSSVCIRGIDLLQQLLALGIRHTLKEHRFSYAAYRKETL